MIWRAFELKFSTAHSLEVAKAEIGFLLNADDSFWEKYEKFIVPEDFEFKNDFDPDNSLSAKLGQAGVDIARSKYDEIKTGFSPVVELIGSAGHRSKNRIDFQKHGQELTLGLSLTLPITDRYLTRRKLEQAREEIRKSELEKVQHVTRQRNSFNSENLRLSQAKRSLDFQKEMLDLQKKRLADIKSAWPLGIYDKSDALLGGRKVAQKRDVRRTHPSQLGETEIPTGFDRIKTPEGKQGNEKCTAYIGRFQ